MKAGSGDAVVVVVARDVEDEAGEVEATTVVDVVDVVIDNEAILELVATVRAPVDVAAEDAAFEEPAEGREADGDRLVALEVLRVNSSETVAVEVEDRTGGLGGPGDEDEILDAGGVGDTAKVLAAVDRVLVIATAELETTDLAELVLLGPHATPFGEG